MVKIRNLSGTDKVVSDDLLPVWVNAQGDTRKASMNTVKAFMQSGITTDASGVTYIPEGTGAVATTADVKFGEQKSLKDFGAKGDGVTDDTVAIKNWLEHGGNLYADEGTYLVAAAGADAGGVDAIISKTVSVNCHPSAVFKAGTNLDNDIIRINCSTTGYTASRIINVFWRGGQFNMQGQKTSTSVPYSAQYPPSNVGASATTDGLSVRGLITVSGTETHGFKNCIIENIYADASPTRHWQSSGGDSAIFINGTQNQIVANSTFIGCRDLGIYASGLGNASNPLEEISGNFYNNKFYGCIGGVSVKRYFDSATMYGNVGYNCATVCSLSTVTGGSSNSLVFGNLGVNCWRVIVAELAVGSSIFNNQSYKHGMALEDGTAPSSPFSNNNCCVNLRGASFCKIYSNTVHEKNSIFSGGLQVIRIDDSGGTDSSNNLVYNNFGKDVTNVVEEVAGDAVNHTYWRNFGDNVDQENVELNGTGSLVLDRRLITAPGIGTTLTPTNNGDLTFETTSNTSVTLKLKGSDGVVRSVSLTLS